MPTTSRSSPRHGGARIRSAAEAEPRHGSRRWACMTDLLGNLQHWRMAGPGGFRRLDDGSIESHGGSGLFWYAAATYDDFRLAVDWRISRGTDNSGVFIRIPPLGNSPRPAIERG